MTKVFSNRAAKSAKGQIFAPGMSEDGRYFVFRLCSNYAGHVRGGIAKSWRVVSGSENGLTLDAAKALMEKKVGRKLYGECAITEYYKDRADSGQAALAQ